MREGMPQPAEMGQDTGRDLQKDFDKLLQGENGVENALKFLAQNKERNPQYAERRALEVLSRVVGGAESLASELRKAHLLASARELQASLYAEYRQLSDRQRTKNSFRDFVEEAIGKIGENGEEEREFWEVVRQDLDTVKTASSHLGGDDVYTVIRTRLPHYRKGADAAAEKSRKLQAINGELRKILAGSETA